MKIEDLSLYLSIFLSGYDISHNDTEITILRGGRGVRLHPQLDDVSESSMEKIAHVIETTFEKAGVK